MNFLNYDSPFMTECRKLVNFILLGLLWILASIPVITAGAATTAMFYTGEKNVRKDAGKIWSTFWKTFRKEFKQATLLWLIGALLTVILANNCLLLWRVDMHAILFALLAATVVLGVGWMQLWFWYLSKFEDTTRVLLGNTFRIALISLPRILLLFLLAVAAVAVIVISFFFAPPVILLVPGIYLMAADAILRKIFRPYLPEETDQNDQPAEGAAAPVSEA